ncbi:MAG: CotH kinase family protein, partial [Kiritimatiellae bacterium]|nr:CotH kinase family protein [Kiritimatiellia bacterium]
MPRQTHSRFRHFSFFILHFSLAALAVCAASAATVSKPTFSAAHGFYSSTFSVKISSATAGATIRYTTDGSLPTASYGTVLSNGGSVSIGTTTPLRAVGCMGGMTTSAAQTQTYIFTAKVIRQTQPSGYPSVWGAKTADYDMDQSIVNGYTSIQNDLKAIPTLSIVGNKNDFFTSTGVYYTGGGYNSKDSSGNIIPANTIEKPVSVELIYPAGFPTSFKGFQIDCGIRAHSHTLLKRSFKLFFRAKWGPKKLSYPFFESAKRNAGSAATRFDKLVLRAGCNDMADNSNELKAVTYTRDQWARDSLIEMTGIGSHGIFVHLYINGMYWGVYNPCERPEHSFSREYLDRSGSKDNWFAVDRDYEWGASRGALVNGGSTRWAYLHSTLRKQDLSTSANYQTVQQYLDLTQYCDDIVLHWYSGCGDWPGNNWYACHRKSPATPAKYFGWDMESSWIDSGDWGQYDRSNDGAWVHPAYYSSTASHYPRDNPQLFRKLVANSDFKALLADRAYKHLYNGGALTESNAKARWSSLCSYMDSPVVAESARWGDGHSGGYTYNRNTHFRNARNYVNGLMTGNVNRLISAMQARGWYPSITPPTFSQYGGTVAAGFKLTVNKGSAGTLYYRTDGEDPRASGGGVRSGSASSTAAVVLTLNTTATVKARMKNSATWSALA